MPQFRLDRATHRAAQVLLDELKTWCAERGRKTQAAQYLAKATGLSFETAQQTLSHLLRVQIKYQSRLASEKARKNALQKLQYLPFLCHFLGKPPCPRLARRG